MNHFPLYPRDWLSGTNDLTPAARGVYINLLCAMYDRGGPLPYDERQFCRIVGCATVRSLRQLLGELIAAGKLSVEDGHLTNARMMAELAKFRSRRVPPSETEKVPNQPLPGAKSSNAQNTFEPNTAGTQPEHKPNEDHVSSEINDLRKLNQKREARIDTDPYGSVAAVGSDGSM